MTRRRIPVFFLAGLALLSGLYLFAVLRRAREVRRLKADLSPEEISERARDRARERRERGLAGVELAEPAPVLTAVRRDGTRARASRAAQRADAPDAGESIPAEAGRPDPGDPGGADASFAGAAGPDAATGAFLSRPRDRRAAARETGTAAPWSPPPADYADPGIARAAASHAEKMLELSDGDPGFRPARYIESIPDFRERAAAIAALGNASPESLGEYGKLSNFSSGSGDAGMLARAGSLGSSLGGLGAEASSDAGGSSLSGGAGSGGGAAPGRGGAGPAGGRAPGGNPSGGAPAPSGLEGKSRVDLKLDPARMTPAGPQYATDKGKPKTVQVYRMLPEQRTGPLYFTADMDIDADGAGGHYKSDKTGQSATSLRYPGGASLDPGRLPFFVLPSDFSKSHPGVSLGDLALVQYRGKQAFAVYGDNGPRGMIGEGSIALANMLGINADPNRGGTSGGVTYIVFPGSKLKRPPATAEEIEAAARPFMKALAPELKKGDLLAEPSPQ